MQLDTLRIEWRPKQKEAVQSAITAIEQGYRNVLIDAPVGFGKTIVNYKIAEYLHDKYGYDVFYTTPQVALLDQIERDNLLGDRIAVIKVGTITSAQLQGARLLQMVGVGLIEITSV